MIIIFLCITTTVLLFIILNKNSNGKRIHRVTYFNNFNKFTNPLIPVKFHSQFKENIFFHENFLLMYKYSMLFSNDVPQLNGIFVVIGAMNGIKLSDTLFLGYHFN